MTFLGRFLASLPTLSTAGSGLFANDWACHRPASSQGRGIAKDRRMAKKRRQVIKARRAKR